MKALIIGIDGFAGKHLLKYLKTKKGIKIYGTMLKYEADEKDDVDIFELDILSYENVFNVIKEVEPDFIYHFAAQSSAGLAWTIPQKTFEINVIGTINILQALRQLNFNGRLLFTGSGEEYGVFTKEELPLEESLKIMPTNIYACSKASAEELCLLYHKVYGLDIICTRSFNHIGPKQSEGFVSADFAKQIAEVEIGKRESRMFVGNLSAVRDFTDVRDVVRAYVLLMEKGISGEVYNVGGGTVCSIREILDILLSMTDCKIDVHTDKSKYRPCDTPEMYCTPFKLINDTGFEYEYSLKKSLRDVLDYWRKKVSLDVR